MGLSRRNVLIGLGGIVAGGGALVGTGAFTTVQAERTVNVSTTGDASAFLALEPTDETDTTHPNGEYAEITDGTLELDLSSTDPNDNSNTVSLNLNARTTIRNIFQVTNNGTEALDSLEMRFTDTPTPSGTFNLDDTFEFTVDDVGGGNSQEYPHPSSGANSGVDLLQNHSLGPGEAIWVGLVIDLIDGGDQGTSQDARDLPNGDYSLEITANTP